MAVTMKSLTMTLGMCLVLGGLAGGRMTASAQASQPRDESYQWSAELVAFDEATRMATVKAMAVGDALKHAGGMKPGEKIMLTWSAYDKYASAINGVLKYDAGRKADSRYVLPAEFVSSTTLPDYIAFKVTIPAEGVARLKELKPGQWVTVTSRQGSHAETQAVTSIRGYNDPEAPASK